MGVIVILLIGYSPDLTIADGMPKVNLVEIVLHSPSIEEDGALKNALQEEIKKQLGRSTKIEKFSYIDRKLLTDIGDLEEYLEELHIRYYITGHMWDRLGRELEIEIKLIDRELQGREREKEKWAQTVRKDLEMMAYWFDKVAREIHAVIVGDPKKKDVFTYCFYPLIQEDKAVKIQRQKLPRQLKTILADKGWEKTYVLETLDNNEIKAECESVGESRSLNVYHYVISGDITRTDQPQTLDVLNVNVVFTVKGADKPLKPYFWRKGTRLAAPLADYIDCEWSKLIKPKKIFKRRCPQTVSDF